MVSGFELPGPSPQQNPAPAHYILKGCGKMTGYEKLKITASGSRAIPWRTVAVSRSIPLGARIYVPALKRIFVVHDRGSKKWIDKKNGMDIFVSTKEEAKKIGRRKLEGVILE